MNVIYHVPASIGASLKYGFEVNSIAVPLRAKDVIEIICKLINKDGASCVQKDKYNLFDSLLKDRYNGNEDVPNHNNLFYNFPGNLNVIVFKLKPYLNIIEEMKGLVPEFVNPKYEDKTRTKFK